MTKQTSTKNSVVNQVEVVKENLFELNRNLYDNPETKFEEFKAAKRLTGLLEKGGFEVERGIGGLDTAFRAIFPNFSSKGPTVALLAEYDALPKLGHACAHNIIASSAVGAALALKQIMPDLEGALQVIGTPGEEEGGGKVILVKSGIFDSVDITMMVHPWNKTALAATSLARVKVGIEFRGKPAHSFAHQEQGINALAATIQTFVAINALREHLKHSKSMVHGIITHGGESAITVPDYSSSMFFIMTPDIDYCREVFKKVKSCAEGAASMTGAEVSFNSYGELKELIPNQALAEVFGKNLEELGVEIDKRGLFEGILCATDAGDVSHVVPTIQPYICLDKNLIWHTPEVAKASVSKEGRKVLVNSAKALAMTAIDLYANKDLLEKVKEEFRSKKANKRQKGKNDDL